MRGKRNLIEFLIFWNFLLIGILLLVPVISANETSDNSIQTNDYENSLHLNDYEKSVLFTEEGYYRSPPALPGEKQKKLKKWELPDFSEPELSYTSYTMTGTGDSGSIQLIKGYNYISTPKQLAPGYDTAATFFYPTDNIEYILTYNTAKGAWEYLTGSSKIKPLVGYVVKTRGTSTLNPVYAYPQTNPQINLYAGWNLIGYFDPMGNPSDDYLHAAMARDELAQLGNSWLILIGWNPQTGSQDGVIIRGFSDSSDYRLTFPKRAYWLYMEQPRTLTFSTVHTYTHSAEWVNDYHNTQPTLYLSDNEANGFFNGLNGAPYWQGSFINGDDNAREIHWKDSVFSGLDNSYIDNTNFAFFAGHGGVDGVVFGYGSTEAERNLLYTETKWGESKVDWIALAACNVLNELGIEHWKSSFKGLHSIVGWSTLGYAHQDLGTKFATYVKYPYKLSIWEAWKRAADECVTGGDYKVAILAVDIDGNTATRECIDDHAYGQGGWMSPQGNPGSNNFIYEKFPV